MYGGGYKNNRYICNRYMCVDYISINTSPKTNLYFARSDNYSNISTSMVCHICFVSCCFFLFQHFVTIARFSINIFFQFLYLFKLNIFLFNFSAGSCVCLAEQSHRDTHTLGVIIRDNIS